MTALVWRYRALPGPTAAHLWAVDAPTPLCGLVGRASGDWREDPGRFGRCGLCTRRRDRYHPDTPTLPS